MKDSKELVFEEKVVPLIRQIAEICQQHDLAFVAATDFGDGLAISHIPHINHKSPFGHVLCALHDVSDPSELPRGLFNKPKELN